MLFVERPKTIIVPSPQVAHMWADLGPHLVDLGPNLTDSTHTPTPTTLRTPTFWLRFSDVGPSLVEFGQRRSSSGIIWPLPGRMWTNSRRTWPSLGRIWSTLVDPGKHRSDSARVWPMPGQPTPISVKIGPRSFNFDRFRPRWKQLSGSSARACRPTALPEATRVQEAGKGRRRFTGRGWCPRQSCSASDAPLRRKPRRTSSRLKRTSFCSCLPVRSS